MVRIFLGDILLHTLSFLLLIILVKETNSSVVKDSITRIWSWNPKTRVKTIAESNDFDDLTDKKKLMVSAELIRLSNNMDYIEVFRDGTMQALSGEIHCSFNSKSFLYQQWKENERGERHDLRIIDVMLNEQNVSSNNFNVEQFLWSDEKKKFNAELRINNEEFEFTSDAGSLEMLRKKDKIFHHQQNADTYDDEDAVFPFDLRTMHYVYAMQKAESNRYEIVVDKTNGPRNHTRIFLHQNQNLASVQTRTSFMNVDLKTGFLTWRLHKKNEKWPGLKLDNQKVYIYKPYGNFEVVCAGNFAESDSECRNKKKDETDIKDVKDGKTCGGYLIKEQIKTYGCNNITAYYTGNDSICIETHNAVENAMTLSSDFNDDWISYYIDLCNQIDITTSATIITIPDNRICSSVLPVE